MKITVELILSILRQIIKRLIILRVSECLKKLSLELLEVQDD